MIVLINLNDYNDYRNYNNGFDISLINDNYINYFKEILFVNKEKAYDFLFNVYKKKFSSLDDFDRNRKIIYNRIKNIVEDYSFISNESNRTYTLIFANGTKLTIVESGLMNVKHKIEN